MRLRVWITAILTSLLLGGCFILSFYPLYKPNDLFANNLLLGEWEDESSSGWRFEYPDTGLVEKSRDSTAYIVRIRPEGGEWSKKTFEVRIIRLGEFYFADFFLLDYVHSEDADLFDFHLVPFHTFARINLSEEAVTLKWMNPEWFCDTYRKSRPRLRYEKSGEAVLLIASVKQLQRLVLRNADREEAFKNGYEVCLHRVNH